MDDLISRQSTIYSIRECAEAAHDNHEWDMEQGYLNAIECVEEEPSAQPEQKMGRWLPDNRPGGGFWVCSECKFPSEAFAANVLYKFCPNCGADMRGEENGRFNQQTGGD